MLTGELRTLVNSGLKVKPLWSLFVNLTLVGLYRVYEIKKIFMALVRLRVHNFVMLEDIDFEVIGYADDQSI